jgi:hypothetical protein
MKEVAKHIVLIDTISYWSFLFKRKIIIKADYSGDQNKIL